MRDEEHRPTGLLPDADELVLQGTAGLRVEGRERLVHQEDRGLAHEGARDLDPLLHASGELGGILLLLAAETDQLQVAPGALAALGPVHVAHAQSELDVLDGGEPAVERVVALEDHRAVAAGAGDGTAFHQDPARRGRLEAREQRPAGTRSYAASR